MITISGSTTLSKEEIDRMVKDANLHAAKDRARKEKVEAKNLADSLAYQAERQITDLGDRVPIHEKARCEQLIADIRQAIKDDADIQRIKSLTSDLQQASYSISSATHQQATEGPAQPQKPRRDDDVIDAEFAEK